MSSKYNGPRNTKESLARLGLPQGCGTTSTENSWIGFTFPQPVQLQRVTIGAMHDQTPGGWNDGYTNGRDFQSAADGQTWTTLFKVDGVPRNGAKTFAVPAHAAARHFRMFCANGYTALSYVKFN